MTPHEQCKEKIESLQQIMLRETPKLPTVIGEIKRLLMKNPEVATLLEEEEIGKLVAGMAVRANVKMAEIDTKGARKKTTASLKGVSLGDI